MAAVAERSLGKKPTAVIALDVPAIAAILRAVGPVDLPDEGKELTAENVVEHLMVGAYEDEADTAAGQNERRRRLRETADAIIRRLLRGGDTVAMIRSLQSAVAGRHLKLWSAVPAEQAALVAAGAAGDVRDDGTDLVNVTVQNFGSGDGEGNKLDYYANRSVQVTVEIGETSAETTQVVTIENRTPNARLPLYVLGPINPGRTNNYVTFAVPKGAELLAFERDGTAVQTRYLSEGNHTVLPASASLARGEKTSWTLRYRAQLAKGEDYRLWLVPQPLARPATLSVDVTVAGAASEPNGIARGSWDSVREVAVFRDEPSRLTRLRDAVRRFWNEPVRIG
jgi:hypothetical protein